MSLSFQLPDSYGIRLILVQVNGALAFLSSLPSVQLDRAEAAIGSYHETPIVSSSPLALCQRKHVKADTIKNVASARINRTESSQRFVAIFVAANCGPAGMKPAETIQPRLLQNNIA